MLYVEILNHILSFTFHDLQLHFGTWHQRRVAQIILHRICMTTLGST